MKKRKENQAITELRRLQMLTTAVHTGEPKEFIERLDDIINGNSSKDIIGDLEDLENLKSKRKQYGRIGDMNAGE
ncbi:hypothetical protein [Tepidimicrobium xylanilyticum]|nr:hypothetical protein [Tepidimicrobium xylanilyticum]